MPCWWNKVNPTYSKKLGNWNVSKEFEGGGEGGSVFNNKFNELLISNLKMAEQLDIETQFYMKWRT
jgi:hypothetical protein